MTKGSIDALLKEINNVVKKIQEKKASIKELEKINLEKSTMNYNKYISRIDELDNTEKSIKMLMENKYFSYIKHIDFLYDSDVKELKGFTLNKDLGCILKSSESRQEISYINKIISIDNKKITYSYEGTEASNLLEYSFYDADSNIPLTPTSIKVIYKDNEDNFYEPHFRFYNRNNTTSFINSFPFQPKKISQLTFEFENKVNVNNCKCNLYSVVYTMLEDNSILVEVENEKKLSAFNISKKTEESIVPFLYYFSEDNINFKQIEFSKEQEGIISLENSDNFYIKIVADNDSIELKEETTVKTVELYSQDLESQFGVYKIPTSVSSSLNNLKVTFPLSSYNKLKEKLSELNDVNIDDFITKDENGLCLLNNEYIDYITVLEDKVNNLKYIDDISVLETDKKYFMVYVDSNNMNIHFSSFMQEFNFFLEIQFPSILEQIDKTYYTPYLFSISLKG